MHLCSSATPAWDSNSRPDAVECKTKVTDTPTKLQHARHGVGVIDEKPLHAALKQSYGKPDDRLEVSNDGFVVDIIRGELLVEIQARNFAGIREKLTKLAVDHQVRLVYPIAQDKWIVRVAEDGRTQLSRRRSPKRGSIEDVFDELVSFPGLLLNPPE